MRKFISKFLDALKSPPPKDYIIPGATPKTHKRCEYCGGSGREDIFNDCEICEGTGLVRKSYTEYVDDLDT